MPGPYTVKALVNGVEKDFHVNGPATQADAEAFVKQMMIGSTVEIIQPRKPVKLEVKHD